MPCGKICSDKIGETLKESKFVWRLGEMMIAELSGATVLLVSNLIAKGRMFSSLDINRCEFS